MPLCDAARLTTTTTTTTTNNKETTTNDKFHLLVKELGSKLCILTRPFQRSQLRSAMQYATIHYTVKDTMATCM
jgi:hypothetical protein